MTNDEMTNDEMTNDEMTNDEMTNDEMTNDEMTNDEMTTFTRAKVVALLPLKHEKIDPQIFHITHKDIPVDLVAAAGPQ